MSKDIIQKSLKDLNNLLTELYEDTQLIEKYELFLEKILNAINNGNTIYFCGNGGSFADSLHLATELVVRFKENRKALNSNVLGSNQCNLTAIGNDFCFDDIFVRELSALYKEGDIVIILSTSGNSKNIIKVAEYLIKKGTRALAILGKGGGVLKDLTENIIIPSNETALIQEVTIVLGHSLCAEIDMEFINNKDK